MKKIKDVYNSRKAVKSIKLSEIDDLVRAYKRFQDAYAVTEKYISIVSPKIHQSTNSQSFIVGNN